ncbi:MAG: hypothetical protein GX587_02855, partial [Bacteroidales bacterium]|nr:hypothetical protein [Bacteroidales bacterium]
VFSVSKKSYSLPVETEYPGTLVHEGYIDDEEWGPFPIGFSFSFFCNNYTDFYVTSNGLVMFGSGSNVWTNTNIPNNSIPNNYIAAFWDDLIVHSTGAIHYKTVGTAPNRKLIVQYTNMAFWNSPVLLGTFQIILYEGSNKIQTQYRSIIDLTNPRASGNSATLGLEKSNGYSGVKNSYNQADMVRSEKAIAYTTDGCSYTFDNNAIYDGVLLTEPTPRAGITKLLSPANNSITSFDVNFKWEAAPNASSYNVIISTNADLSSPIHTSANLTDLNYLYTLTPDQTYYWSVNAKNSNNLVTWTEIWKFTTSSNPPLVAVPQELFLEQNDQRTGSLLFTGGDATTKTATITSLPAQGALFQFDNTPITTVPTDITDDSFRFIYKATGSTGNGVGNFNFRFSDASGTSDPATYTVNVSPAGIPNFLYASKQSNRVEITFDRAMADPTGKHLQFSIRDNGALVTPQSAALKSGDPATIIIYSSSPLNVDNTIEVAYTKGTITALSGGVLESFSFQLAGKKAQVINFDELAAKTYGDPAFTISATASSGLPVTFTSSNSTVAGVSGNTVTINNSGSCLITASQAGDDEFHSVSFQRLLTVNKANATITISNTTQAYTGSGIAVTTATNPVGLPVKVEYDNADALPSDIGAYNVTVEIIHANYQGTASATLTIIDDVSPVPDLASLPDITAECSAAVSTIPTATDNYSGTINGTTTNPLTYNTQGTFVITWSYNDGNG